MLPQLIANFNAILSYDLARCLKATTVLEMFWYVDIYILFIMIPTAFFAKKRYNLELYKVKTYIRSWKILLFLCFSILSSVSKSYLADDFSGREIGLYTMFVPFVVIILARICFKDRIPKHYRIALIIAILGYVITKIGKISYSGIHLCLAVYVFINALSDVSKRKVALERAGHEGIIFENIIYAAVGILGFTIFGGFNINVLLSWQVIVVTIPSLIHHCFTIIAYKSTKSMAQIVFIDFFKIALVLISGFVFFGLRPSLYEVSGIIVMCLSICLIRIKSLHENTLNKVIHE